MTDSTAVNGYGLRAFADLDLQNEFYEELFDIDASDFHVYAAEWTPEGIDFYLDNKLVKRIDQSPDYEMQFMLNIYEVPVDTEPGPNEKRYPKAFEIDYVRAYEPIGGY